MNTEELYYVYSCYADAKHPHPIELQLNEYAFNDLADYIEETKCACVEYGYWDNENVIYFYRNSDFIDTMKRFINHQANVIVSQMRKINSIDKKPF